MTLLRSARRGMMGLLFAALLVIPGVAQDGYRTPPAAITKILDSPGPPAVSVSSDRKWLLITTADVPHLALSDDGRLQAAVVMDETLAPRVLLRRSDQLEPQVWPDTSGAIRPRASNRRPRQHTSPWAAPVASET